MEAAPPKDRMMSGILGRHLGLREILKIPDDYESGNSWDRLRSFLGRPTLGILMLMWFVGPPRSLSKEDGS